jgi:hypothetical protein
MTTAISFNKLYHFLEENNKNIWRADKNISAAKHSANRQRDSMTGLMLRRRRASQRRLLRSGHRTRLAHAALTSIHHFF